MATKKVISAGTGRRKTACARVTLAQGDGKWTVNNVALEDYITSEALRDCATTSSSRSRSRDSTRPRWT